MVGLPSEAGGREKNEQICEEDLILPASFDAERVLETPIARSTCARASQLNA
jgi:hypothetical protein